VLAAAPIKQISPSFGQARRKLCKKPKTKQQDVCGAHTQACAKQG